MERITEKQLEAIVLRLNRAMGRPETPYTDIEGKYTANIGNFHLYNAYGRIGVHEMATDGGGVRRVVDLGTKRETAEALWNILKGIELMTLQA